MNLTKDKRGKYLFVRDRHEDWRPRDAQFAFDKKSLTRYTTRARVALALVEWAETDELKAEIIAAAEGQPDPRDHSSISTARCFDTGRRSNSTSLQKAQV